MNRPDFRTLYAVLDLPYDADETHLRQQYRRLAQRLHPDGQEGDTERFVAVQQAYDALQRFLRDHGHLPLAYTMPPPPAPGGGVRKRRVERAARGWSRRRRLIVSGLVAFAIFYVAWPREAVTPAVTPSAPASAVAVAQPGPTFTRGSTMSEVLDAQGVPDSGTSTVWRYGQSTVHFHEGQVMGWKEHPGSPLNLQRGTRME